MCVVHQERSFGGRNIQERGQNNPVGDLRTEESAVQVDSDVNIKRNPIQMLKSSHDIILWLQETYEMVDNRYIYVVSADVYQCQIGVPTENGTTTARINTDTAPKPSSCQTSLNLVVFVKI